MSENQVNYPFNSNGGKLFQQKNSAFDPVSARAGLAGPSGGGGEPQPDEDMMLSFKKWLFENNPFYLLSVFFMFWGLYLASVDGATGRGPESLKSLMLFYAVENLYEIVMFAMALYLLHKRVNQPHGRLLLFFIIIFLCDATMYQSVIANSCDITTMWVGGVISSVYLILAAAKIGLLVHFLRIRVRYDALFYVMSSLALLYFTPHFLNYTAMTKSAGHNVWWIFYAIMLAASLFQLPVIISSWNRGDEDFVEERDNGYFGGTELQFYRMIVIIPFITVPVQIYLNSVSDLKSIDTAFSNYDYGFIPYLLFSAFFLQSVFKRFVASFFISINAYDFAVTLVIFAAAVITKPLDVSVFGDTALYPHRINLLLIIAANAALFVTRKNYMSLAFLGALGLFYTKNYYYGFVEYINATTARRAVAYITVSFIMLAAGFALSLAGKQTSEINPGQETAGNGKA